MRPTRARTILCLAAISIAGNHLVMNCQSSSRQQKIMIPADFKLEALTGGVHPWDESRYVSVTAAGSGEFVRSAAGEIGVPPREQRHFSLPRPALEEIFTAVQENDFFALAPAYKNAAMVGGTFAMLTITAGNRTHRVHVQNMDVPRCHAILAALNRALPAGRKLILPAPPDSSRH